MSNFFNINQHIGQHRVVIHFNFLFAKRPIIISQGLGEPVGFLNLKLKSLVAHVQTATIS